MVKLSVFYFNVGFVFVCSSEWMGFVSMSDVSEFSIGYWLMSWLRFVFRFLVDWLNLCEDRFGMNILS